jgi:hypothetical protein
VMVEEEPTKFMGAILDFVKQVDDVDYFGLFFRSILYVLGSKSRNR